MQGRGYFLHLSFNFICVLLSYKIISSALPLKLVVLSHYSILHTSQPLYSNFFVFWITAKQSFGHAEPTTSQTMDDVFCLLILQFVNCSYANPSQLGLLLSLLIYLCRHPALFLILLTISTSSIQKDDKFFILKTSTKQYIGLLTVTLYSLESSIVYFLLQ